MLMLTSNNDAEANISHTRFMMQAAVLKLSFPIPVTDFHCILCLCGQNISYSNHYLSRQILESSVVNYKLLLSIFMVLVLMNY